MLEKKFIVRIGGNPLKESIPDWRERMERENPNFEEIGASTYISGKGGSTTIRYRI